MTRIIIASPSYNPSIGGAIVLHKLCHILNNLGYDSYLTSTLKLNGQVEYFHLNENYNTKIATEIDIENDIIIYPEIESGNPYGCKNVVRYILNNYHLPDSAGCVMDTWDKNDYWLYFHNLFYDGIKESNFLHIIDTKLDVFKDYGLERKIDACFTYRKKSTERNILPIIHSSNSIEIEYNIQDKELVEIFNSCKRFYSYDTETYLSVLAAQCGCESIIVPYKDITKDIIINNQPSFKYGIAYGLDDLEHANSTRHLLKEYLQRLEDQQIIKTKTAFEKIFNYFNL
jgi:hypothetical protein